MSLLDRHVDFVAALRDAGVRVSVAEGLDAIRSVQAVELIDREQLRAALAATLIKRSAQRAAFDTLFDLFYPAVTGEPATTPDQPPTAPQDASRGLFDDPVRERIRAELRDYLADGDERRLSAVARDAVGNFGAVQGRSPGSTSWSRLAVLQRVSAETLMAGLLEQALHGEQRGGLAERRARTMIDDRIARFERAVAADISRRLAENTDATAVARTAVRPSVDQVAFLAATRTDLAALRREIQPLARKLAARLTLEQRRGSHGHFDFRRTLRASLSSGGVPMELEHRPKRPNKTDLVVLCDLSESVTSFAHFTLLLVYALREQFTRVRAFGFVDELDELTRFFTPGGDVLDAVTRLAREADVTWLLGRTDYGRAFELFAERFPDAIGPKTSLLVLGDARSNYGDLGMRAFVQLAESAKHSYWLNPERQALWDTGDSRASEYARVMPMAECRNLAQLAQFVRELAPHG
ncbi:MAG TPA: VWA domain-containing protein [Jatrophihabitans sp.]|nr:VWA domain-containing protein [Jatrophihabitans sp.]